MGLFKILRGDSSRISTTVTPFHDGYAYFTPDDGKLYIDAQVGSEQKRICVSGASIVINDETPTYTVASANANLSSGEKISTAFGKIAKAISSLISHLADKKNPHGVTAAQVKARPDTWMPTAFDVGARPSTWTPSASDVGADASGTASSAVSTHNGSTTAHSDIRTVLNGKAAASVPKTGTLTSAGWSTSAPYTQVLSVANLAATSNGNIAVAQGATVAQRKAARRALLSVTKQEAGKLTITADGEKPGTDIPVVVTIIG